VEKFRETSSIDLSFLGDDWLDYSFDQITAEEKGKLVHTFLINDGAVIVGELKVICGKNGNIESATDNLGAGPAELFKRVKEVILKIKFNVQ